MAIKIINPGTPPRKKEYFQTCDKCGCEFSFAKEDVKHHERNESSIECPTCKKYLDPDYKIPV